MYKNLNLTRFVASIVILVSLSSCYGYAPDPYYIPLYSQKENFYYLLASPHSPLLKGKGDFNASFLYSGNNLQSSGEAQIGFMPSKNIGIMTNLSLTGGGHDSRGANSYTRFELGAGYVKQISNAIHLETYVGLGTGTVKNSHYTGNSKIGTTHFFLQPSLAISTPNQNVQFAFVSRFAGVNFNVKDTMINSDREQFSYAQLKSLYNQPFHFMWEPGFIFKFGWENFQVHTSYSFSADFTNPDLHRAKGTFAVGFTVRNLESNKKKKVEVK